MASGLVVRDGHDVVSINKASVKPDRNSRPVQEERNFSSHSKDKKASIINSSPKLNRKNIQTPKKEDKIPKTQTPKNEDKILKNVQKPKNEDKLPKQTKTLNLAVGDKKLKSSLDVARKCRNDFPPILTSSQEKSATITQTTTATKPNNQPSHLKSEVPQFQTLTLKKADKGKTKSDDPRFNPVKSPREELLSSIRNRQGINSLKPIQGSLIPTPPAPNPPPPPPPLVTKTAAVSKPSKFSTNVDPRDDLLSAIRNNGGIKSLRPVKRSK